MLEAITLMQSGEWLHSQLLQVPPVSRTVEVPSIEPAKDGYVGITMVTGQQWLDFAAMVDCPELTEIPQLSFQIGRWQYRDFIRDRIRPWLAERTVEEIVELGQLFRLPIAALGNGATVPGYRLRDRTRGVRAQPGGLSPAAHPMADVAVPARAAARRAVARRGQRRQALAQARARRAAGGAPAAARGHTHYRPDRVLGRAGRNASACGLRCRRRQGGVDPASRRHPVFGRHAQGCRRLVGVRLGFPRHEHQQAFGHPGFGIRRRPSAVHWLGRRRRRGDREFLPAGDGPLRAHRGRLAGRQPAVGDGPDAGVRAGRSVARPGRFRAHDGADRRAGLGDRVARRSARPAAGAPAIRWPVSTPHSRCWPR